MKDYEKMTVKELVEELTSLGVSFNKKSRKAELIELLISAAEGKSSQVADRPEDLEAAAKSEAVEKPVKEALSKKKSAAREKAGKEVAVDSGYAIIRTG
ncbi:MAG: hypothetical protein JRF05_09815, partial [Deltaproteobacteria bacterium]|nr:hypothetical protein [Deltaproteobacteria bacterium]